VCYGNRYARPSWEGHYDFLFPAVLGANVGELVLEFARKGYDDLQLFQRYQWDRRLGLGVIDVKSMRAETVDEVVGRVRRGLDVVPAERLVINPDCGLRHVPPAIARAKLRAMVEGARTVRAELTG
jgi:5-methyltetrahydropteroyltriglutamate--homocysteine methyltransferase